MGEPPEAQPSKSEVRNPEQFQNSNSKIRNGNGIEIVLTLELLSFVFVSNFGFRVSNLFSLRAGRGFLGVHHASRDRLEGSLDDYQVVGFEAVRDDHQLANLRPALDASALDYVLVVD
jgi:hypothetical protein